jgi:ureidoglycolate dehydrogenase (NAD+)
MVGDPQLGPILLDRPRGERQRQTCIMAALNISLFTDPGEFAGNVDDLIEGLKALPTAEGVAEVLVPGEPEDRARAERQRTGIPLPEGTLGALRQVSQRLGIPMPEGT